MSSREWGNSPGGLQYPLGADQNSLVRQSNPALLGPLGMEKLGILPQATQHQGGVGGMLTPTCGDPGLGMSNPFPATTPSALSVHQPH